MKRYFILGTDTDCGKTYVTCALLRWFKRMQQSAHAVKPVASGGAGLNNDILHLKIHNVSSDLPVNLLSFKEPLSPHLAAKREGYHVTIDELVQFCTQPIFSQVNNLLIEGAGGLMVPLNEKETWVDLLKLLEIPVLLVVGLRLGCLNHAFLTEAVLQAQGISCVGWVANCLDKTMQAMGENIETLASRLTIPLVGVVAYGGEFSAVSVLPLTE